MYVAFHWLQFNSLGVECRHRRINGSGSKPVSNTKTSTVLNEQYNSVFSTPDPTMTIKCQNDFFEHPQANTLSDINITRETSFMQ